MSIKLRSYVPYGLVPVAVFLAVLFGIAFGHLAVPKRERFPQALAWFLFVLFIVLLTFAARYGWF